MTSSSKKPSTKIVDPDEEWGQDWRTEWQEAKKKLDFYPVSPPRGRGRPRKHPKKPPPKKRLKKETEHSLTRFCFHCQKIKEGGAIMQLNLLPDETCIRPVFICAACQKKYLRIDVNEVK